VVAAVVAAVVHSSEGVFFLFLFLNEGILI